MERWCFGLADETYRGLCICDALSAPNMTLHDRVEDHTHAWQQWVDEDQRAYMPVLAMLVTPTCCLHRMCSDKPGKASGCRARGSHDSPTNSSMQRFGEVIMLH